VGVKDGVEVSEGVEVAVKKVVGVSVNAGVYDGVVILTAVGVSVVATTGIDVSEDSNPLSLNINPIRSRG
jgi:hypothetical protein